MSDTDLDQPTARTPRALAALAGLACTACCLLPALITAGVVGAGASAAVGWLPAIAAALAVLAAVTWWLGRRHAAQGCGCAVKAADQDGCSCRAAEPQQITIGSRR